MPDDTTLTVLDAYLSSLYSCKLVRAWDFLDSAIKDDEVPDDVQNALFFTDLSKRSIQVRTSCKSICIGRFPFDKELFPGSDGTVA